MNDSCKRNALTVVVFCSIGLFPLSAFSQYVSGKGNDATAPLHMMKPDYTVPYGEATPEKVEQVLHKVYSYLNSVTPWQLVNKISHLEVNDINAADSSTIFKPGDFRLLSYEWGVTYTGMLEAGAATGDTAFTNYTLNRVNFIGAVANHYRNYLQKNKGATTPVRTVLNPHALDDAGAIAASMIKAIRNGANAAVVRPVVDNYLHYITTKEFRLSDGTLARNRPHPNTLWLDDLYMSLPAIAQMGILTGDNTYFTEAVKQYHLFATRMFNKEKNLYMHGWVQEMNPHPQFHWARANGWALMTKVELLDALPESFAGRSEVLNMLKLHVAGLAERQDKTGFWHQLLDKNDSYLETSATAIYTYCIARAINKGWLDVKAYGPMVLLAWNAISTQVTDQGQVQNTCVGTGMGFDPAFYYYRPVSNYAAHGYGPLLLAGAEIYRLLKKHPFELNDSAVQMK